MKLTIIKITYEKLIVNGMFNGEKLRLFPPRPGIRQVCPLLTPPFNTVLDVHPELIGKKKKRAEMKPSKLKGKRLNYPVL